MDRLKAQIKRLKSRHRQTNNKSKEKVVIQYIILSILISSLFPSKWKCPWTDLLGGVGREGEWATMSSSGGRREGGTD